MEIDKTRVIENDKPNLKELVFQYISDRIADGTLDENDENAIRAAMMFALFSLPELAMMIMQKALILQSQNENLSFRAARLNALYEILEDESHTVIAA